MSDWFGVDNSIVQGDPLSMLLYLFYNADLLLAPKKGKEKLAYIDDANFYVEGSSFEEAYKRLHNMMKRDQGSYDWSWQHKSHFKLTKMAIVGFTRRCRVDPHHPGKTVLELWPDFHIQGAVIKPSPTHIPRGSI